MVTFLAWTGTEAFLAFTETVNTVEWWLGGSWGFFAHGLWTSMLEDLLSKVGSDGCGEGESLRPLILCWCAMNHLRQ